MIKFADPVLMRGVNKYRVLEAIRGAGQISRVELSEQTLLSATTVSTITGALMDEGLIRAIHSTPPADAPRGRPRVSLSLIPNAASVAGVMVTETQVTTTLSNFSGIPVFTRQTPAPSDAWTTDQIADAVEADLKAGLLSVETPQNTLRRLGLGIAGQTVSAPDLVNVLQARLGLPVTAESPSNLITPDETGLNGQPLVVITVGPRIAMSCHQGIGPASLTTPIRTRIDHLKVPGPDRTCCCGQKNCLHAWISPTANLQAARNLPGQAALPDATPASQCARLLTAAATGGDTVAAAVLAEQGAKLGHAAASTIALLNPARVLVGVTGRNYCNAITPAFLKSLRENCHVGSTEILLQTFDDPIWAEGAAALVLRALYSAPWTQTEPKP